jgi:hypothetical protein
MLYYLKIFASVILGWVVVVVVGAMLLVLILEYLNKGN